MNARARLRATVAAGAQQALKEVRTINLNPELATQACQTETQLRGNQKE